MMFSLWRSVFGYKAYNLRRFTVVPIVFFLGGCQSALFAGGEEWAAHGFMGPAPVGESELIGVYDNPKDCDEAAKAWTERQVAGNPVSAECYRVGKN